MSEIPPNEPPQQFVQYPRGSYEYSRPPTVDLNVLGPAWTAVQAELATWVLSMLIVGAVVGVFYVLLVITQFAMGFENGPQDFGALAAGLGLQLIEEFVFTFIFYALTAGLYGMALKQLRGEKPGVGDMFNLNGQLFQILLASFLTSIIVGIGTMMCLVPGFLAQGLLMFTVPIIVDQRLDAVQAMRLSFERLRPQMWMALLVYFVLSLVGSLGALLCVVGLVFTWPIVIMSISMLYRDFFWQRPASPFGAPPAPPVG